MIYIYLFLWTVFLCGIVQIVSIYMVRNIVRKENDFHNNVVLPLIKELEVGFKKDKN